MDASEAGFLLRILFILQTYLDEQDVSLCICIYIYKEPGSGEN